MIHYSDTPIAIAEILDLFLEAGRAISMKPQQRTVPSAADIFSFENAQLGVRGLTGVGGMTYGEAFDSLAGFQQYAASRSRWVAQNAVVQADRGYIGFLYLKKLRSSTDGSEDGLGENATFVDKRELVQTS